MSVLLNRIVSLSYYEVTGHTIPTIRMQDGPANRLQAARLDNKDTIIKQARLHSKLLEMPRRNNKTSSKFTSKKASRCNKDNIKSTW